MFVGPVLVRVPKAMKSILSCSKDPRGTQTGR